MKFEWDEAKNRININKHGISFQEAIYVFSDPFALSGHDSEHSEEEDRWVLLGKNLNESILLVVHTFRTGETIRLISARKATKNERSSYIKRVHNER